MDNPAVCGAIAQYLADYSKHRMAYVQKAESVRVSIKKLLDANGIMAIVSCRAKEVDRLREKLYRVQRERGIPFESTEEIGKVIHDLVGVRIALYFPDDGARTRKVLETYFHFVKDSKVFPPRVPGFGELEARGRTAHERKIYPGYDSRRFDGYHATHHYLRDKSDPDGPVIEVQVASVLMHAWSEVEHDLAYKKMTGEVSAAEYECLDEINGLVIAGEIALNRLKRLSAQRSRYMSELKSAYNLKEYLRKWLEEQNGGIPLPEEAEGDANVQLLFDMYHQAGLLNSAYLEYRLKTLGKEIPGTVSALVQLLIDRNFDENRQVANRVKTDNLTRDLNTDHRFYTAQRLAGYLGKWNALEDTIRKAVRTTGRTCPNLAASWKYVVEERVLPAEIAEVYRYLRLRRNAIVHTNRLPEEEAFRRMLQDMDELSARLKRDYGIK